jgi:translation initiation factor IF-2
MMIKYRLHEVAKDFDLQSKELVEVLKKYTGETKKSQTALEENELDILFDYITQTHQVESFDEYFSYQGTKKEEPKAEVKKAEEPKEETKAKEEKTEDKKAEKAEEKKPAKTETKEKKAEKESAKVKETAPAPKKKEKQAEGPQPNRHKERRIVDTRSSNVDMDKYNEKYDNIAASSRNSRDDGYSNKQKINRGKGWQDRNDHRKGKKGKKETEQERLERLMLERQKKSPIHITVGEEITVGELASRMKIQATEIVKKLMGLGIMASVSQTIDFDTAYLVASELNAIVEKEVVVTIEDRIIDDSEDKEEDLVPRSPIVVVMGHVDHGKTSLLDAIRNTNVISTEAGGITQHIGAYRVSVKDREITFLDTPGHAAFTAMRARGAQATDIAILVVAADDGIMPQTIEAIHHAKEAGVSMVVAINKIDKEGANPNRVLQELAEHEVVPEEWGGDTICVPISAKQGTNIDTLLESLILVADMQELKANPNRSAKGTVIEARLDKGRGPVATVLVQNGTLNVGDIMVAGTAVGKVRVMTDDRGNRVQSAGPSMPVEITGLAETPLAGDTFNAVTDEKLARELVEQRKAKDKEQQFNAFKKVTLDNLFEQISEGEMKDLNIIVKADVQGSVEAIKQSLEKLSNEEVRVKIIHGGVGAINESDVMLANASNAIIVGFNVRPDSSAKENAAQSNVDIRLYSVIYDCIEEIETAMKGMLAPKYRDVEIGKAEARQIFKISNVGVIAGSYVQEGKIARNANIRVIRDGIVIFEDKLQSLRREKDDVKEVKSGFECGIKLEKFNDLKEGDIFEAYITEEYRED